MAVVALAKLMRRRETRLVNALRQYVETQLEWSRKRAKAARLARQMAKQKSREEIAEDEPAAVPMEPGELSPSQEYSTYKRQQQQPAA